MRDIIAFLTTLILGYICFIGLIFFLGKLFFPFFTGDELRRKENRWKRHRASMGAR
jgi:hypothetical protein